jgi:hypothetical protein
LDGEFFFDAFNIGRIFLEILGLSQDKHLGSVAISAVVIEEAAP